INQYVHEGDNNWDIALYSGDSEETFRVGQLIIKKEQRKVTDKGGYYEVLNRQVSSGNAEAIVFPKDVQRELGSKRKDIRAKMKKPLLMLHVLKATLEP